MSNKAIVYAVMFTDPKTKVVSYEQKKIEILPNNGKEFTLKELQGIVEGYIEVVYFPNGMVMVANETGKLDNLPVNEEATKIFEEQFQIENYSYDRDDHEIVGNVVICPEAMLGK